MVSVVRITQFLPNPLAFGALVGCRDVHGNEEEWGPMGPIGFLWEWE